ncbi:cell division protein ZapD [mine drainage metagenome]|uniref:Cell division protein ZapD n=1 Tax=mine drainage metagenome TaxID=410659 RepID=A0A1J5PGW4_9ZZZZ
MILYEYPLNERVRTLLRLEHLFRRADFLLQRAHAYDHHYALLTMFEIMDVVSRQDLKSDLLKELERQRQQFLVFRGNPAVAEDTLDAVLGEVDAAFDGLSQQLGKPGQALLDNEWLMALRSRAGIPGGTCEFDLPAYYAWQHLPDAQRSADMARWMEVFAPLAMAVELILRLLRDAGAPRMTMASGGCFQQTLGGRTFQLLRLRVDGKLGVVPETTGHRLMVSVRFMRPDADWKLKAAGDDVAFELALCP